MTIINRHFATATASVPVFVEHAATSKYTEGFELNVGGWTAGANSEMAAGPSNPRTGTGAATLRRTVSGTGTASAARTITGLTIGRSTTFTVWIRNHDDPARRASNVKVAITGGSSSGVVAAPPNTYQSLTFGFTPTATSHEFVISGDYTGTSSYLYIDDISVTQDAWSEYVATDVDFDITEGAVSLDSGWAPYAQGSLTVPLVDESVIEALDPRDGVRVNVDVQRTDLSGDAFVPKSARSFDLGLRARKVDHEAATITLDLMGDEALLQDYLLAGPADVSGYAYQSSVRTIVNNVVLSKIGASLDTGTRTNLCTNPKVATASTNWSAAGVVGGTVTTGRQTGTPPAGFTASYRATVATGTVTSLYLRQAAVGGPGVYDLGAWVYSTQACRVWLMLDTTFEESDLIPANTWTWLSAPGFTRALAFGGLRATFDSASWGVGDYVAMTGAMVATTPPGQPSQVVYFDGDTTDTAAMNYAWSGTANASTSTATPTPLDTSFVIYEDSENLATNPKVATVADMWTPNGSGGTFSGARVATGGPTGYPAYYRTLATNALNTYLDLRAHYDTGTNIPVSAGKRYTVGIDLRTAGSFTVSQMRLYLSFMDSAGTTISAPFVDVAIPTTSWGRRSATFTAPANATQARVVARAYHATVVPLNAQIQGTKLTVIENTGQTGYDYEQYFDGATTDIAGQVTYAWTGTADASTSTRTSINGRSVDALRWATGEDAWSFVQSILENVGYRLFCDEQRRWLLIDSSYTVQGRVTISEGFNATSGTDAIDLDGSDWYDSVVVAYRWIDSQGTTRVAYDYAGPGTKGLLVEYQRPYPGPGTAAYILSRSNGRGRVQAVEALSEYEATPAQEIAITLPGTIAQSGTVKRVAWNLRDGLMRIESQGLVDTPPNSWLSVPPGVSWNDMPNGVSWNSYVG